MKESASPQTLIRAEIHIGLELKPAEVNGNLAVDFGSGLYYIFSSSFDIVRYRDLREGN